MSIKNLKKFLASASFRSSYGKNCNINNNIQSFFNSYKDKKLISREKEILPEVLIPCHPNHIHFLPSAVSSISIDIPVTIITDTFDGKNEIILKSLVSSREINLIVNESLSSQAKSINNGVMQSSNNLFIILNADDFLFKYSISTLLSLFNRYPTIRLAGGGTIPFSHNNAVNFLRNTVEILDYIPDAKIFEPKDAMNFSTPNDINMTMSGSAFLKSAWETVDGFWDFKDRVCSYDDRDFQMRVSALFNIAVIDEPLSLYRIDSSLGRGQI
jgi:cellulose synthase/poly-beta-1,6-N-acetylglucosamine synthase-like glycosyltransferase